MKFDLSIRRRMALGFGLILGLLLLSLGVTIKKLQDLDYHENHVVRAIGGRADLAVTIQTNFLNLSIALHSYIATRDLNYLKVYRQALDACRIANERLRKQALDKESERVFSRILKASEDHERLTRRIVPRVENSASQAELAVMENQLRALRGLMLDAVGEFSRLQTQKRLSIADEIAAIRLSLLRMLIALYSSIFAIGLAAALLTTHAIRHPARRLVESIEALEHGDYAPALALGEVHGGLPAPRNELHAVAGAFGRMADTLRRREARLAADGRIATLLAVSLDPNSLAERVLGEVVDGTRCQGGAIYILDEGHARLRLAAARALLEVPETLDASEQVVSQAMADNDGGVLQMTPEAFPCRLSSGSVTRVPQTLSVVPLIFNKHALGLMVLAGDRDLDEGGGKFVEHCGHHLSVSLQNALTHRDATRLTEELRLKNRQLEVQNEMLHAQSRQLQAQSEQFQRQNELLAEADRRKDEFLAMLAHELRNPLAAISNAHCVLDSNRTDEQQAARMRAVITRQIRHLSRMIDDLLDVSRITRGLVRLRKEPLNLRVVVQNAAEAARCGIENNRLTLEVGGDAEEIMVEADLTRLEQILINLLSNATKYTEPQGHIGLSVTQEGDWAVIRVRDTGIGIAPDVLPHIFDLFMQADGSPDRTKGGLGIGLTTVRSLVEMHGGRIEARSEGLGRGSEFIVRLPMLTATTSHGVNNTRHEDVNHTI